MTESAAKTRFLDANRIDNSLKHQWIEDGYVVMPGLASPEQIERHRSVVRDVRTQTPCGIDAYGFGDRIGQLHQAHPVLLDVLAEDRLLAFLDWALDDEAVVFGSLNFDKGTQQEAHIDAIFFYPAPIHAMVGVWIALEDVRPDAGPLFYLRGSHRWPFAHSDGIAGLNSSLGSRRLSARDPESDPAARGAVVSDMGIAWTDDLLRKEREFGVERTPVHVKAGDALVWHSLLAHGGAPRRNPALSRYSTVFHFIGKTTQLYSHEQFMLWSRAEMGLQAAQPMKLAAYKQLQFMKYPYFVTYDSGRELVHPL